MTLFNRSLSAAAIRADRESLDDLGTALVNQIASGQSSALPLSMDNYQVAYNAGGADFYVGIINQIDAFYQAVHSIAETATRLVASATEPPIRVTALAGLQEHLDKNPSHQLAGPMRKKRRSVRLLRWLCTVRNKAVQHRSKNGYIGNRAIIQRDGIALLRKPEAPEPAVVGKANSLLRGFNRKYGSELQTVESREAITYLDLASYSLYSIDELADFDSARGIVEEARAHDLVMSRYVIATVDSAIAALVELAPIRWTQT
jgi:hypothetical protein